MTNPNPDQPKGFLQNFANGYKEAIETLDHVVSGIAALASQPVIICAAGTEYLGQRIEGKSVEEAKKAASDFYDDLTDRNFDFCEKHASTIRRVVTSLHGIDTSIHDGLQAGADAVSSIPDMPDHQAVGDFGAATSPHDDWGAGASDVHFGYHGPGGEPLPPPDVDGHSTDPHTGITYKIPPGSGGGSFAKPVH